MHWLRSLALVALAFSLAACSADRQVFNSTISRPASVEVIDTVAKEALWSMDIPAGHRLVVEFNHREVDYRGFEAAATPATSMNWWLWPLEQRKFMTAGYYSGTPTDEGLVELSGNPVMVNYTFREPEDDIAVAEIVEEVEVVEEIEPAVEEAEEEIVEPEMEIEVEAEVEAEAEPVVEEAVEIASEVEEADLNK